MDSALPTPSDARVLVVGLVRNGQGKVTADVRRLELALKTFGQVKWLLVESDSSDGSVAELQALRAGVPGFNYLSLGTLRERIPQRTARIAHCRNAYLEQLETNPEYSGVDLVVMADFDGINKRLDATGILSCWERHDWDVCTANQDGPYYDVWALRHELWSPNDCRASHKFLVEHGMSHEDALFAAVFSRMVAVPVEGPWIAVDSAFGGLAIYRREFLHGLRYCGLTPAGDEVCEHVGLHAAIRARGGRLFLNPRMVCAGRTEHTQPLRLVNKLFRMLRHALKRLLGVFMPGRFANARTSGAIRRDVS